jgi:hypothetical protein
LTVHLQAAWPHFVDEAVFADPWLAGMLESSAWEIVCVAVDAGKIQQKACHAIGRVRLR